MYSSASARYSSASARPWLELPFAPIALAALNATAGMLERIDNKYIVPAAVLRRAVPDLAPHFDILEIDGRRGFAYETRYFDDPGLHSYFDHHQGRRKRVKVRTRKYVDAGLCFVEVKLKDTRGRTIKKRLPYHAANYGTLDERAWAHIRDSYRELYDREFPHPLEPMLDVHYVRATLVAKAGGERMTIDSGLCFLTADAVRPVDADVFIIEAKSVNGNGIADQILRRLHQHPTKHCSKYCAGTALMATQTKHNNFRPALRKLGVLPAASGQAAA